MIELDSTVKEETEAEERVAVFSINGVVYDMPAKIKPHLALRYLWLIKNQDSDYATAWLMETMLGKDGFEALSNYEDLTMTQFKAIADIVRDTALGALEDTGKAPKQPRDRYSGNGRKKSSGSRTTRKT